MLKIGLTGGIGCGKSTVAKIFAGFDVPIIDADEISHQLVAKGQPALLELKKNFGDKVLNIDGSLNRIYLKNLIFSSSTKKQRLESILHPLIYTQIKSQIANLNSAYCIICIPLLIETQKIDFVDRVLVIDCSKEQQIERVKQRDNSPISQIKAIIASQASREEKLALANDVIDNSKKTTQLVEQVEKLHLLYLSLSSI